LFVTGSLNPEIGGRPVKIPIEPEVYNLIFTEHERDGLWPVNPDKKVQDRRSIYLYNKRSVRLPMLSAFDQPDAITSCPVRSVSTHALQALSLMNSDFMAEQSKLFAERLQTLCKRNGNSCRINNAWQLAFSRKPTPAELKLSREFLANGGSFQEMCLAILNRNEFVYVP
jgi:hypothetical protein